VARAGRKVYERHRADFERLHAGKYHLQRGGDEAIVGVGSLRLFQKILVLSVADGSVVLVDSFADLTSA
jgi:hypothetical protein